MKNDRDDSIGRLLPGTLNARAAAEPDADADCLDAETLAAWADDELDRESRAAAEAHAADCARCQAMLAAMVRTAPAPAAARSPWRLPALGWLVPATAAVAALLVWTMVPERASKPRTDIAAPADQLTAAAPADKPEAREPAAEPLAQVAAPAARRDAAGGAIPREQAAAGVRPDADTLARQETKQEKPALEKDAPAAPSANALADSARAREAVPASPLAAPVPAPARPPSAGAPASTSAAKTFALARAVTPATVIVSSNPDSRWRIVPGGAVEHSADGGSTWQAQQTGSPVTLTAGAAPSPTVCWLVGPGGIVLLSSDARSWRRVSFPESADLVAVSATDDKTATVTLADGRTLSTSDAGASWR